MKKMHILIVVAVVVAMLGLAASAVVLNQPGNVQGATSSSDNSTSNWTKVAISHQSTKNTPNFNNNTTAGEGIAVYWTDSNMSQMSYLLFVSNATNLMMAHIHEFGPNSSVGPIVAWLYPSGTPTQATPKLIPGVSNGLMVAGTITAANLTGPLQNQTIKDLVAQMNANNTLTAWHSTEYPAVYMWGNNTVSLSAPINATLLKELAPKLSGVPAAPAAGAVPASASSNKVTMDLTAQNIKFDQSTITVPAGANVTINFHNKDQGVQHNFAVYDSSSMKTTIFRGPIITGVSDTTYTFTAPTTPGTYYFQCDVHGSAMSGSLVVK